MSLFILADNQDLTRIGLESLCAATGEKRIAQATNKKELLLLLQNNKDSIVILDYTLFDFKSIDELIILHQRFPEVHWILISEELSSEFARRIALESYCFSIITKSCDSDDLSKAIRLALRHERYICHQVTEQILSASTQHEKQERAPLTPTELDVLREIALGKTTKEIAFERKSSFHTINTHRKNIFRKLDVNTAYEAIRYARRAGLIDTESYYI